MADNLETSPPDSLSLSEAEAILRQLAGTALGLAEPIFPEQLPPVPERGLNEGSLPTPVPLRTLSSEALWGLVEAVPDALVAIDRSGRLVLVNRQTEELFRYHRDELLGQPIEILLPDRFREKHVGQRDGYFATPHTRPMGLGLELVGLRKDGHEVPVEISLSPLPSDGDLLVVATIRDVTPRRKAEAQLRKMEARYRTLVEGIPAVTFMAALDEVGERELYVSPQIERLLGFSQQEWLDNPVLWYSQLHPDDKARWHEEFALTVSEGKPFNSVYRFLARNGQIVWVHGEAQLVRDEAGRPLFLQGVAFDVTGIKEAEEDLKNLNTRLEEKVKERTAVADQRLEELGRSNAALALFASTAAHDLLTPVGTIQTWTQVLAEDYQETLDLDGHKTISRVVNAARRMNALINDLLAYSKVRTEGKELRPVECARALDWACKNLGAELQEAGEEVTPGGQGGRERPQTVYQLEEAGAEVTAGELPMVLADPTQLGQLFQNLIGNALKYRSARSPRIHVSSRRSDAEWVIDVEDNGIGIEDKYREKIFDLGVKSRLHKADAIPGSGIGLATCKTIVERHGGRIWATSPGPDKGTTISFTMPAVS